MKLRNILLLGVLIRVILMPFFAHPFDIYAWYVMYTGIMHKDPFIATYSLPMLFYTMIPIAYLYHLFSTILHIEVIPVSSIPSELNPGWGIEFVPGTLFNSIIKIPFVISDILVAFLTYKTVEELTKNQQAAQRAATLLFLNPLLMWMSAGWGMFDTLPAMFTVASLLLLVKRRTKSSATCLAISALYKLYAFLLFIPFFIFLLKTREANRRWEWLGFLLTFTGSCILIDIPRLLVFGARQPLWHVQGFLTSIFTPTPFFGLFGFGLTYWSISSLIPLNKELSTLLMHVLMFVFMTLAFITIGKSKFTKSYFDLAASELSCLVALFLSYRIICEQYFVWALPFFIIVCIEGRIKNWLYGASSIIALVYAQKNFPLYLLPAYPWIGTTLVQLARLVKPFSQTPHVQGHIIMMPSFSGALILTVLGFCFSFIMLLLYFRLISGLDWKFTEFFKSRSNHSSERQIQKISMN